MSRRIHQAPFAVASNGTLLLNVAHFARRVKPEELLKLALAQPGELFIGVRMSSREATYIIGWCKDIHEEAIAHVVGKRQRRMQRSQRSR